MFRLSPSGSPKFPLPTFLLGQNAEGQRVVRELTHGVMQRRFADRKQAIRFALYGSGVLDSRKAAARLARPDGRLGGLTRAALAGDRHGAQPVLAEPERFRAPTSHA